VGGIGVGEAVGLGEGDGVGEGPLVGVSVTAGDGVRSSGSTTPTVGVAGSRFQGGLQAIRVERTKAMDKTLNMRLVSI
jgi:hypothetical protein